MKKIIPSICLILFLLSSQAWADHGFYLNGLIINDAPIAVINERTVRKNDTINGWRVKSMDETSVTLENSTGESITITLPDEQMPVADNSSNNINPRTLKRFNSHLQKAADNLYNADRLFHTTSVSYVDLYTNILKLCDSAEREAQHALELSKIRTQRTSLEALVNAIRNLRTQALTQRKDLEEDISNSIKEKSILLGMTKTDARKSWGRPLTVNYLVEAGSKKEEWIYRRVAHKSTYLYFENDVLTAIAY